MPSLFAAINQHHDISQSRRDFDRLSEHHVAGTDLRQGVAPVADLQAKNNVRRVHRPKVFHSGILMDAMMQYNTASRQATPQAIQWHDKPTDRPGRLLAIPGVSVVGRPMAGDPARKPVSRPTRPVLTVASAGTG